MCIHSVCRCDLFFTNADFQVVICKKCESAIRLSQIVAHLIGTHHGVRRAWAQDIQHAVAQWDHIQDPTPVSDWPHQIDSTIPGIPIHAGLVCTQCRQYTCRELSTMKIHWRDTRQFRAYKGTSQPSPAQQEQVAETIARNCEKVLCQRLFTRGPGSHFIQVASAVPPGERVNPANAIEQLIQETRESQRRDREASNTHVQAGYLDEATPWLNRAGWVRYLEGVHLYLE